MPNTAPQRPAQGQSAKCSAAAPNTSPRYKKQQGSAKLSGATTNMALHRLTKHPSAKHSAVAPKAAPQRQTQRHNGKPSFHSSLLASQPLPSHSAPSRLLPQSSNQKRELTHCKLLNSIHNAEAILETQINRTGSVTAIANHAEHNATPPYIAPHSQPQCRGGKHTATAPLAAPQRKQQRHTAKHNATTPKTTPQCKTQLHSAQCRATTLNIAPHRPTKAPERQTQRPSLKHSTLPPNIAPHGQSHSAKRSFHPSLRPSPPLHSHFVPSPLLAQSSNQIRELVQCQLLNESTECIPSTPKPKQESGFTARSCKSPGTQCHITTHGNLSFERTEIFALVYCCMM